MKFNEKILKLRKEKGYSQEELSFKLNVARQTISKWESGITTPDMENLVKLSNLFEVSVDEIIGNEHKKEEAEIVKELNHKSKFKKIIKILAIIVLIVIIIFLIYLGKIIYNRYNFLTRVYLNFSNFHYKDIENFYYYERYNVTENSKSKEDTSIDAYLRGDKFKIMYYQKNLDAKEKEKFILNELVRVEFRDKDIYYDIDVVNKTYTKEKYELEKSLMYSIIREMEYKLDYKLKLSSGWNRLFLACNYFYKIYLREVNKEQDIIIEPRIIQNYKDMIQVKASYLCNSEPYLNYKMDTYTSDNKHISEAYEWHPEKEQYAEDWLIELPDLTEYVLIEN